MNFLKRRSILWLLIPAAFVVAFFWDSSNNKKPEFVQAVSNPDYFLMNTTTTEFDSSGKVERQFTSDKTLHFLFRKQTKLENPTLLISNDKNKQWQVKASQATNHELTDELVLEGQVAIELTQENTSPVVLSMQKLTIDFASENAFTDSDVFLNAQDYKMSASGMSVDLLNNTIEFKSKVVSEEL